MDAKDPLKLLSLGKAVALLRKWQTEKTLVLLKSSEPVPRIQDRPVEIVFVDSSRLFVAISRLESGQKDSTERRGIYLHAG
jgi:hypothetical protein